MLALAERLPKDRFEVEFVVLSGPGPYDERARAAGLPVRYAGATPQAGASPARRLRQRLGKVIAFIRLVRAGRYDVVDAWLYPADMLAAFSRLVTRTPVVVSGRRNVDPQRAFGPLEPLVSRVARRLIDATVANSQAAGDHAVRAGVVDPSRLRIIRNGVVIPTTATPDGRAASRAALGGASDEILIGCVANFLPVKRHDLVIDAFAAVLADVPSTRLVLIGDGPLRPAIEAHLQRLGIADRARLLGSIREPETLLAGLDLVVQASDREGLPNALLEAGAAGLPMVATDAGGSGEIVRDGLTGFLVPRGDARAIAAALRRLALDAALRESMGRAAREHVSAEFGMDRFVAEFAALYESLVAEHRRR